MATGEQLLAAIRIDPRDDLARLAYADWLEEHGDDARAEFIRLQLELARLTNWDHRRRQLQGRERNLLAQHRQRWVEHLPEWARPGCEFSRGFVTVIECSIQRFEAEGRQLMECTPLEGIRTRGSRRGAEWLAGLPHLARLSVLYLEGGHIAIEGITALARSPYVTGLTSLGLVALHINDDGARVLAQSPHLAGLTSLDLGYNAIADEGARALLQSPHLAGLTRLYLDHNLFGRSTADALRQRFGEG